MGVDLGRNTNAGVTALESRCGLMNQTRNDSLEVDSEIFVVGDLRVDIGQQRVMRSGTEITLPNLSFQLLVALIRAAPNVLSHDALMERVWPALVVSP